MHKDKCWTPQVGEQVQVVAEEAVSAGCREAFANAGYRGKITSTTPSWEGDPFPYRVAVSGGWDWFGLRELEPVDEPA